jgi:hypothetical protein
LAFLNTWDFPIYLGLVMLSYGAGKYWAEGQLTLRLGFKILALGAALGAASILLYIFFYTGFTSQAGGILPYVFTPTRLAHYLVMFGPFIFILAFFAVLAARCTAANGFPMRMVLRVWMWITGITALVYLLVVLVGGAALAAGGAALPEYLQPLLNSDRFGGALVNILLARLANPWLFLLLSTLLALSLTAVLQGGRGRHNLKLVPVTFSPPVLFALLLTSPAWH